jgi:hypothetical protein
MHREACTQQDRGHRLGPVLGGSLACGGSRVGDRSRADVRGSGGRGHRRVAVGRLPGERHDHERTMETRGQSCVAPSLDWQNAPRTASLLGCAKI